MYIYIYIYIYRNTLPQKSKLNCTSTPVMHNAHSRARCQTQSLGKRKRSEATASSAAANPASQPDATNSMEVDEQSVTDGQSEAHDSGSRSRKEGKEDNSSSSSRCVNKSPSADAQEPRSSGKCNASMGKKTLSKASAASESPSPRKGSSEPCCKEPGGSDTRGSGAGEEVDAHDGTNYVDSTRDRGQRTLGLDGHGAPTESTDGVDVGADDADLHGDGDGAKSSVPDEDLVVLGEASAEAAGKARGDDEMEIETPCATGPSEHVVEDAQLDDELVRLLCLHVAYE